MNYPTTFAEQGVILDAERLSCGSEPNRHAEQALAALTAAGFVAVSGLCRVDLPEVVFIANTDPVRESCPNDITRRVGSESMAEAWHAERDGKGVVVLKRIVDGAIAGYGWTSLAPADEKAMIPDEEVTFAERLGPLAAGRRLGAPFAEVIVASAVALHGARNVGLQTWGSNTGAVKSYLRAGARLVTTVDDYRPTIEPSRSERRDEERPGKRRDVRLFMKFGHTFLNS